MERGEGCGSGSENGGLFYCAKLCHRDSVSVKASEREREKENENESESERERQSEEAFFSLSLPLGRPFFISE